MALMSAMIDFLGAGGGIRTHEGLRHGITHPRSQTGDDHNERPRVKSGLECSARVLVCEGRDPPIWSPSRLDLTLVPPPDKGYDFQSPDKLHTLHSIEALRTEY